MRKILLTLTVVIAFAALLSTVGCAQSGSGGGGTGTATATTATTNNTPTVDCVNNPTQCNSQIYQNTYGFYSYGYNTNPYYNNGYWGSGSTAYYMQNNAAYLCNCPTGYVPTYNNYAGLGCVSVSQVYGYNTGYGSNYGNNYGGGYGGSYSGNYSGAGISAYAYFGYAPNNNQWTNIPQISNYQGYSQSNCYNGVVQSCLTDQQNSCSAGYTCRASSAGSRLGLCVGNSSSQYGQVYR